MPELCLSVELFVAEVFYWWQQVLPRFNHFIYLEKKWNLYNSVVVSKKLRLTLVICLLAPSISLSYKFIHAFLPDFVRFCLLTGWFFTHGVWFNRDKTLALLVSLLLFGADGTECGDGIDKPHELTRLLLWLRLQIIIVLICNRMRPFLFNHTRPSELNFDDFLIALLLIPLVLSLERQQIVIYLWFLGFRRFFWFLNFAKTRDWAGSVIFFGQKAGIILNNRSHHAWVVFYYPQLSLKNPFLFNVLGTENHSVSFSLSSRK